MFLPFHDDNPTRRTAIVTYALIAMNLLSFLWFLHLAPQQRLDVTLQRGFVPKRLTQLSQNQPVRIDQPVLVRDHRGRIHEAIRKIELPSNQSEILWSLLTCMFLHAGWVHLLGNMWFLWLFGNNVEDRLGHLPFLLFYLVGGLLGSACHWAIDPSSTTPVIGASGAVAAVLGAYAITWPWARIHTLVFVVIFFTIIDLPALAVLGAWFLLQLFHGQAQLGIQGAAGGVAFWAHVGGFLAGMGLMPLLGLLLGLGRPPVRHRRMPPPNNDRDRIIDVQILDNNDHPHR